jgi:uncharacterized OB-fold protein
MRRLNMSGDLMIEGKKCARCGHAYFCVVDICSRCGNKELAPVKFSGKGIIYSFTINYVPPLHLKDQAPYVVGIVDLAEGPRITVRLNTPRSELKIGQEVRCVEITSTGLVFF